MKNLVMGIVGVHNFCYPNIRTNCCENPTLSPGNIFPENVVTGNIKMRVRREFGFV